MTSNITSDRSTHPRPLFRPKSTRPTGNVIPSGTAPRSQTYPIFRSTTASQHFGHCCAFRFADGSATKKQGVRRRAVCRAQPASQRADESDRVSGPQAWPTCSRSSSETPLTEARATSMPTFGVALTSEAYLTLKGRRDSIPGDPFSVRKVSHGAVETGRP